MRTMTVLTANDRFNKLVEGARKAGHGDNRVEDCQIVGIDPGETTGVAYYQPWKPGFQVHLDQVATKEVVPGYIALKAAIPQTAVPQIWVIEDYRVYGWKADDHRWAGLHTPKLIGAILILAYERKVHVHMQMAIVGKEFATDELLKSCGLYDPGMKHARDASRHLVRHTFFGKYPFKDPA